MKMIKFALLGTAAIAAVSVSARADSLSDLKAQIEALNARVATIETAPAVPAGFSLMTVGSAPAIVVPGLAVDNSYGTTATQIGIMPTADAPASTVVQWSGYVKAALVYDGYGVNNVAHPNSTYYNVVAKTGMKVVGKTDTAVGEVGVSLAYAANWNNLDKNYDGQVSLVTDGSWGWWKMTPELTLGGGYSGSLSGIGYGYDGACTCNFTDNANAGYGNPDAAQMRLSYASGPMSAAIAIEDYNNDGVNSAFGAAAEVKYSGDTINGEISGGWRSNAVSGAENRWVVGAGLGFALGDMAKLSVAAGLGSGDAVGDDWWKASALARINLNESSHFEVAFNHVEAQMAASDQNAVLAGIYYDPVSQLTIGLEGEWIDNPNLNSDARTTVDLVTVFRF